MGLLGLPGLRSEDRMLLRARRRISLSLYLHIDLWALRWVVHWASAVST